MRFADRCKLLAVGLALALVVPVAGVLAADAEPGAADKPAAPVAAKAEQVAGGLQVSMVLKERTFRMGGGDNAQERKVQVPTLVLKNVGDKALVLGFQLSTGGAGGMFGRGGGAEAGPVKFLAKDAGGKEVPGQDPRPAAREDEVKPEDRPAMLTVLKPGQVLEQAAFGAIRFPADGKYTIWAEVEVKAAEEVLPGVKPWSGKLKSNELEYDYKGVGNRGNRGNRGGGQNPAPAPVPGAKENF